MRPWAHVNDRPTDGAIASWGRQPVAFTARAKLPQLTPSLPLMPTRLETFFKGEGGGGVVWATYAKRGLSIAFKPGRNAFLPSSLVLERSELEPRSGEVRIRTRWGVRGADGRATAARRGAGRPAGRPIYS